MVAIRACFIMRMAGDAGKHGVIARVGMAVSTHRPFSLMRSAVNRESGVAEYSPAPPRRGVAWSAVSWESSRHVVGIGSAAVLPGMAGITVSRRSGIHACDVTVRALNRCMRAGQSIRRSAVIKEGRPPGRCGVADGAILRETGRDMIRVG
jgi:hypothetical protein